MIHVSLRRPIFGGIVFAIILIISSLTFIEITGILAREILETSVSGIITLCYVISIGSIYILVIILHLLSARVPREMERDTRHKHFKSILNIAKLATLLIIFSVVIILFLNIPFTRLRVIPDSMYSKIYYLILFAVAILGGSFISIITMIYQTIREMIYFNVYADNINTGQTERNEDISEENIISNKEGIKTP